MIIIFLILGLIIGSFLNVVIYRLYAVESIVEGRSKCPHCKNKIRWYDNIPFLSFLILRARCRECGEKISWRYPAVEIGTGLIFALVGNYFFDAANMQSWLATVWYLFIFALLIVIFVYDFQFMEIPMIILWVGVYGTIVYYLLADYSSFNPQMGIMNSQLYSGLLAGIGAFFFFFLLSAGTKEKWMGMGDAYLALLAGLIVGWPNILLALMLAFTAGAIYGIILMALGRKKMKSQVPFAPFIVIGIALVVLVPQIFPAVKYLFLGIY